MTSYERVECQLALTLRKKRASASSLWRRETLKLQSSQKIQPCLGRGAHSEAPCALKPLLFEEFSSRSDVTSERSQRALSLGTSLLMDALSHLTRPAGVAFTWLMQLYLAIDISRNNSGRLAHVRASIDIREFAPAKFFATNMAFASDTVFFWSNWPMSSIWERLADFR